MHINTSIPACNDTTGITGRTMAAFECPRCRYCTNNKYVFRSHLSRKRECPTTYSNVSLEELLQKHLKSMSEQTSKRRRPVEPVNVYRVNDLLLSQQEVDDLKEILKCKKELIQRLSVNDTHCAFGYENTLYISPEQFQPYLDNSAALILHVVMQIFYNDLHPENKNVLEAQHNRVRVYRGNSYWSEMQKNTIVRRMLDKALDVIEYTGTEMLPKQFHDYINKYYNGDIEIEQHLQNQVSNMISIYSKL